MCINKYKSFIFFALISSFVVIVIQKSLYQSEISYPQADAFWYIDYAVTLKENNTFGYSGTNKIPSNVITPLYPFYLSLLLRFDENLAEDFSCLLKNKNNNISEEGMGVGPVINLGPQSHFTLNL